MTAGTAEVVITTKLFRPGLRQQTVERKRLHDLLREGRTLPLTLVVAPAGWGKSTIVADWLARDAVTAGWVSLDGGDNDPKRFWRYLLLAAHQAGSAAGAAALRRLDAAGSDVLRDVLPAFVNELASAEAPLVLVLDDYHLVTSTRVHATIATLLERSPPQLHLMLITRADPPLPLSRLRVREDLAELRAEDLRFSAGEAVEFFSSRLGPLLSEQDVLRLLARTEGWAAGLQLAALPSDADRIKYLADLSNATQKDNPKLALKFAEDARALVAKRASDYRDMENQLRVAELFANIDPKRSFDVLEPGISQLNELLAAAQVLNGFEVEVYRDGELPLQGGSELGSMIGRYGQELASLAKLDFERAQITADRFQFAEPRLMAKLAIVQGAFGVRPSPFDNQRFNFRFGR